MPLMQFLQQMINGVTIGAFYSLVALGYTMVYGVLKLINFAHGDLFMWGAYLGLSGLSLIARLVGGPTPWAIPPTIVFVMVTVALAGVLVERVAYRPLRTAGRLAPVISALGVAFVLQSLARNVYGAEWKTYPHGITPTGRIILGPGVSVSQMQVVVLVVSFLLMGA